MGAIAHTHNRDALVALRVPFLENREFAFPYKQKEVKILRIVRVATSIRLPVDDILSLRHFPGVVQHAK